jgi:hypothetical protein
MGIPPINTPRIGIKLVRNVIHPRARRYGKIKLELRDIWPYIIPIIISPNTVRIVFARAICDCASKTSQKL